jgi:hypothetical protein
LEILEHIFDHSHPPTSQSPVALLTQGSVHQWVRAFLGSSIFVALLAAAWTLDSMHAARKLLRDVNVIRKLKFAKSWSDLVAALGLPDFGSSSNSNAEASQQPAEQAVPGARAAVARAKTIAQAAIRALRADFAFSAAYALLFLAISLAVLSSSAVFSVGRTLGWAIFAVLGATAATLNVRANDLAVRMVEAARTGLIGATAPVVPRRYTMVKWGLICVALLLGSGLIASMGLSIGELHTRVQ